MKPLKCFVVRVDKKFNDSIELSNGTQLYIETKFEEFKHRVNEGEVVYTPIKLKTNVKKGDRLYFHHHVVVGNGQPLAGEKDCFIVNYSETAIENQAFAYRPKGTEDIIPLGGWVILDPIKEDHKKMSEIIEVVHLKETDIKKGRVVFDAEYLSKEGVKVGDVVGFNYKFGYAFKIDGKTYFRMRLIDLLYVEEEVL